MKRKTLIIVAVLALLAVIAAMTVACDPDNGLSPKKMKELFEKAGYTVHLYNVEGKEEYELPKGATDVLSAKLPDENLDEEDWDKIEVLFFSKSDQAKSYYESKDFEALVRENEEKGRTVAYGQIGKYVFLGTTAAADVIE